MKDPSIIQILIEVQPVERVDSAWIDDGLEKLVHNTIRKSEDVILDHSKISLKSGELSSGGRIFIIIVLFIVTWLGK